MFPERKAFLFRQLDARDVHPTHGILYWRNRSSLPCRTAVYEYVAYLSLATLGIQMVHCQSGLIRWYIARSLIRSTHKPMLAWAPTMGLAGNGTSCMPLLLLPFGVGIVFTLISAELIEEQPFIGIVPGYLFQAVR